MGIPPHVKHDYHKLNYWCVHCKANIEYKYGTRLSDWNSMTIKFTKDHTDCKAKGKVV